MITMSRASAQRIVEVLDEKSDIVSPKDAVKAVRDGSVDFDHVSFRYASRSEKDCLSDIDLHIPSGAVVGVLGGTGAGKSTLVQLIPRLYDPSQGAMRVGGVDTRKYDLTTLRDSVAMVLQKNELFSGTIKDNLRWGNEHATDAEIMEACRLAQADPDALIREGFRSYIPDTTKIIIAQRVASVQDADMIVVLDNGRIADCGTHEELLARCEIYREVYQSQTKGGEDNE